MLAADQWPRRDATAVRCTGQFSQLGRFAAFADASLQPGLVQHRPGDPLDALRRPGSADARPCQIRPRQGSAQQQHHRRPRPENILIPIVTVVALQFGSIIAFSIVTETVFAWPCMGKLIIDSIRVLDRPVIVAYLLLIVTIFIVINLVADQLHDVLNPRLQTQ